MGQIKKNAGPKHEATISPAVSSFVATAVSVPLLQLGQTLTQFSDGWPLPRGDLYHWIPLLNRFDEILEAFNKEYGLDKGPQEKPFGTAVLEKEFGTDISGVEEQKTKFSEKLVKHGWSTPDADLGLVEAVLRFSRRLLENCGNRSLYSSSERLGDLLNTSSLPLLTLSLQLMLRLAQRYHASRQRSSTANQHMNNALLASHYNIDLAKVQKLAEMFAPADPPNASDLATTTPSSIVSKRNTRKQSIAPKQPKSLSANDMLSLLAEAGQSTAEQTSSHSELSDIGNIKLTYARKSSASGEDQKAAASTPSRRPSNLSKSAPATGSENPIGSSSTSDSFVKDNTSPSVQISIPLEETFSQSIEDIINNYRQELPSDTQYDLLTRLRVAKSATGSLQARQDIVAVRLLAVSNLAYIYTEDMLKQKILRRDSEEPRALQLVQQTCGMVQPPTESSPVVPLSLQIIALGTLEAFAKVRAKQHEVCSSLSINVNHGILFYLLRKAVAEMAEGNVDERESLRPLWRDAVFALLDTIPSTSSRAGEILITAGLLDILVQVLNVRTDKAERMYPKTLTFLNNLVGPVREAFQVLSNANGLDTISDLVSHEVTSSIERAKKGKGLPKNFQNRLIDYQIPFYSQQTLRMIFRIMSQMMTNTAGNFDRLLRNFIDSANLLEGLRTVIVNPRIFGSSVWSGAVNIMSSFIHNEPTSYAIISEAGLSKAFLQTLSTTQGVEPNLSSGDEEMDATASTDQNSDAELPDLADTEKLMSYFMRRSALDEAHQEGEPAKGILPVADAIVAIPHAFGALCLNHAGMSLLRQSNALDNFFEIFISPTHVKSMSAERDLGQVIGNSFDELVRHHPALKILVVAALMKMIDRVKRLCIELGRKSTSGAKLWKQRSDGSLIDSAESTEKGRPLPDGDGDVMMGSDDPSGLTRQDSLSSDVPLSPHQGASESDDESSPPNILTYITVAIKFLFGFAENPSLCAILVESGAAEKVLEIATLPVLRYDFNNHDASFEVRRVLNLFTESKPHLVLPAILQHTKSAIGKLQPLHQFPGPGSFFAPYTALETTDSPSNNSQDATYCGTSIVQSLVAVQTLCNVLVEIFSSVPYSTRSPQTPFSQVNLTDQYISIIVSLGYLHRICVWEEILLLKRLPESWVKATQVKGYGMGSAEADKVFGFVEPDEDDPLTSFGAPDAAQSEPQRETEANPHEKNRPISKEDQKGATFRNAKTLRFLLCQVPSAMIPFLQSLGKSLLWKRRVHNHDLYLRQNASFVANAITTAYRLMFDYDPPKEGPKLQLYSYWIVTMTSASRLLIEGGPDRPQNQVLTLLLQSFVKERGLDIFRDILNVFKEEVETVSQSSAAVDKEGAARLFSAFEGIKVVFNFYTPILSSKSVVDATQSQAMQTAESRPGHSYYFNPHQFLVEMQLLVLPVIRSLWESPFLEKAPDDIIRGIIEVMRISLDASDEHGIPRRHSSNTKPDMKVYEVSKDKLRAIVEKGVEEELAREALYRCMNVQASALTYCQRMKNMPGALRFPIPDYDQESSQKSIDLTMDEDVSNDRSLQNQLALDAAAEEGVLPTSLDDDTNAAAAGLAMLSQVHALAQETEIGAQIEVQETEADHQLSSDREPIISEGEPSSLPESHSGSQMEMNLGNLQTTLPNIESQTAASTPPFPTTLPALNGPSGLLSQGQQAGSQLSRTLEDLHSLRADVRKDLIVRVLDILNVHEDATFELADLLTSATANISDSKQIRQDITEKLIGSLISFELGDEWQIAGKKVAAYANLLALLMQTKEFFDASSEELIDSFGSILSFVKLPANQTASNLETPWISQTLLVLEKILSEDAQPPQIKWTPPSNDSVASLPAPPQPDPPRVSNELKISLFENLLKLMPSTGKDESMVLSITRILVILSRDQKLASNLAEKRNIQRFFLMIKQLAGMTDDKLVSAVMCVIRHMFENDEIIRRIIRSEIRNGFENRPNRPTDMQTYARHMSHLAIRSPNLFVEESNEVLELTGYDSTSRPQALRLKQEPVAHDEDAVEASQQPNTNVQPNEPERQNASAMAKTPSKDSHQSNILKPKTAEPPSVEHPSGVIHYLLCELLSYKDTDDSVVASSAKLTNGDGKSNHDQEGATSSATSEEHVTQNTSNSEPSMSTALSEPKKAELRPEQHPIHRYRCFILQCLTELLQSYNQAKVEFINFSRKTEAKATTPSKPRSGVLNYLLNDAIPTGFLQPEDSVSYKKHEQTSTWAMSTVVALCLRTNELGYDRKPATVDEDDQADLVFVRKFVLEHVLKSYKDNSSPEEDEWEIKYSRYLNFADLLFRLLEGQVLTKSVHSPNGLEWGPQKAIAKLMFEKNFIATLTTSISEIDLSLAGADRAIKYILRPLKILTANAVAFSESSSISSAPGHTDDDEISSATSLSEIDEAREETPDLFRNSTLAMFEPTREDEPSSRSASDEDEDEYMYDDEFDERGDYEDEMGGADHDEVVSDEEEELGDIGPIEGLHGDQPMDVEVVMEEDDEDDEDDSEDDDEDDDDEADEVDEIIERHENGEELSIGEDDENDWEDEMEEDDDGDPLDDENQESGDESDDADSDHLRSLEERASGLEERAADLIEDMNSGPFTEDPDPIDEEDDDDDEDEEEDDIDYNGNFGHEQNLPDLPWGFNEPDEDSFIQDVGHRYHHHHHHRHGHRHHTLRYNQQIPDPWAIFSGGTLSHRLPTTYRTPRMSGPAPRSIEDGTNPLLQRQGRGLSGSDYARNLFNAPGSRRDSWGDPDLGGLSADARDSPVTIIHNLIAAIGSPNPSFSPIPGMPRNVHIRIDGPAGHQHDMQTLFRRDHQMASDLRMGARQSQPIFMPQSTWQRWTEEAKMLFGASDIQHRGQRVTNSLLQLMVPPAIERKKQKEGEEKAKQESIERLREQERKAREEMEKREREEAERAQAEAAERPQESTEVETTSALERPPTTSPDDASEPAAQEAMEGVENIENQEANPSHSDAPATAEAAEATPASSEQPEHQYIQFNGTRVDITALDIDLAYLEALPEDIRNEVLMSQLATQRAQTTTGGEAPTEIDNDFLEALPPDIRAELLQQEAQERRRREREEARRQQATNEGAARAEEMDPASFLASLDPQLRQHVLMEQDEDMLAHLPAEIAEEARALGNALGGRGIHRFSGSARLHPPGTMQSRLREGHSHPSRKLPRRQVIQMMEKPGIATLLRLMFVQQNSHIKLILNEILRAIAQNRQSRAEVLGLLLSLLQDGSIDTNAVEKTYQQLSMRSKAITSPKTPSKRSNNDQFVSPNANPNFKVTPSMLMQQCMSALLYLTGHDSRIPPFFLNENEMTFAFKTKGGRKGKGKENRASKYPINALLSLLDRPFIVDHVACVEALANLLHRITSPLAVLLRSPSNADEKTPDTIQEGDDHPTTATRAVDTSSASAENLSRSNREEADNAAPMTDVEPPNQGEISVQDSVGQTSNDQADKENSTDAQEKPDPKKSRKLTPPIIPEENLGLVVNIIMARECPSTTFRATLATMTNLCAVPGAKEAFGKRLVESALSLAVSVLDDLNDLISQIHKAQSGIELQAMALNQFSPQSSDQAKLLRVLKALDYLFDPKRDETKNQKLTEASQSTSKTDLVSTLYEDPTFLRLWNRLSECLVTIRQGTGMINVATILLPLVESLMVVCTNTTMKGAPIPKTPKDSTVTSPSPDSRMESLFFNFTEEHRKILNELVRQNPKLMSGTFQLLVQNPKVLEFDNKRNYFARRLHQRGVETKHSQPPLQFAVRRDQIFLDSFASLSFKSAEEIKYGKLNIRFMGEEGVDAGGVTREWFQVLSRQMFNPDYALFIPVASDRTTFHPNKLSMVNEEHLTFFKFIGRIIGKALYEGRALDCHFSRAVYKRILGKTVSIKDMETLDLDYYKSLLWMLENDITDVITETMSVETDDFGVRKVVDLVPNGREIPVTEENKHEYVQLVVEHRLVGSVHAQLENFLEGFNDIVPPDLVSIFNEQELELLISGLPDIDVDDWKNHSEYHNYQASSPQIQWFWRAVRSFDKEERAKLLQFVTGTSKVPLNGFGQLEGMNGYAKFNIHRDYGDKDRLPSSHTCFNQLDLPEYEDYESLRKRLYTAMTAGSEYFGFA